jgi:thiol:disulfide interchange protein DsbD
METFKQVLAFPLYATAAWLVWVLSLQSGSDGVVAAMALAVGLAFAAWLAGGASTSGALRRWAALAVFAAVAAGALRLLPATTATGLAQTSAQTSVQTSSQTANAIEERLGAIAFSTDRIATLQAEGRTVFVNMTAAWCISCKVNERLALSSDQIAAAFAANKVAYVKGDWTKQDERITEFLRSFGRAGVPLYLVYPPRAGAEPRVLPQLLTESIVLDAIRSASRTAQRN